MTESEWWTCGRPIPMLELLRGRCSARKMRLVGCACCRHPSIWRRLSASSRAMVDIVERQADGAARIEDVRNALSGVGTGPSRGVHWKPSRLPHQSQAIRAVQALAIDDADDAAWRVVQYCSNELGGDTCNLIREIVGDPFRAPPVPGDRALSTELRAEAEAIYSNRTFDRLPALADSLSLRGFGERSILDHFRILKDPEGDSVMEPQLKDDAEGLNGFEPLLPKLSFARQSEHVRGCWAMDLILSKA